MKITLASVTKRIKAADKALEVAFRDLEKLITQESRDAKKEAARGYTTKRFAIGDVVVKAKTLKTAKNKSKKVVKAKTAKRAKKVVAPTAKRRGRLPGSKNKAKVDAIVPQEIVADAAPVVASQELTGMEKVVAQQVEMVAVSA